MPATIQRYIEEWRFLHSHDTVEVWNDERVLDELIFDKQMRSLYLDNEKWSPTSNKYQYRSNIFRLHLLYRDGGLWVDADLKPLKPIWPLLGDSEIAAARESKSYLNNGILWARSPRHLFYADCLELLPDRIMAHPQWRSNRQCGPHLITTAAARWPELHIIPTEAVYPLTYEEAKHGIFDIEVPDDAYAIHAWNNARNQLGRPLV